MRRRSYGFSAKVEKRAGRQAPGVVGLLEPAVAGGVISGHGLEIPNQVGRRFIKAYSQRGLAVHVHDAVRHHGQTLLKRASREAEMNFKFVASLRDRFRCVPIQGQGHSPPAQICKRGLHRRPDEGNSRKQLNGNPDRSIDSNPFVFSFVG